MDILFYEDLIPTRNANRPKFMAYLDSVLRHGIALGSVVESIVSAYDLENAAGEQLNVIGDMVGLSRRLAFSPPFGGKDMSDEEYRLMIQLRIAHNFWDGTCSGAFVVNQVLSDFGIDIQYIDNMDMTVQVQLPGTVSQRLTQIIGLSGLLPVPAGVNCTFTIIGGEVEAEEAMFDTCIYGESTYCEVETEGEEE